MLCIPHQGRNSDGDSLTYTDHHPTFSWKPLSCMSPSLCCPAFGYLGCDCLMEAEFNGQLPFHSSMAFTFPVSFNLHIIFSFHTSLHIFMTVNFRHFEFSQRWEGNVNENALASKIESFSRSSTLAFLVLRGDLKTIFPTQGGIITLTSW